GIEHNRRACDLAGVGIAIDPVSRLLQGRSGGFIGQGNHPEFASLQTLADGLDPCQLRIRSYQVVQQLRQDLVGIVRKHTFCRLKLLVYDWSGHKKFYLSIDGIKSKRKELSIEGSQKRRCYLRRRLRLSRSRA